MKSMRKSYKRTIFVKWLLGISRLPQTVKTQGNCNARPLSENTLREIFWRQDPSVMEIKDLVFVRDILSLKEN